MPAILQGMQIVFCTVREITDYCAGMLYKSHKSRPASGFIRSTLCSNLPFKPLPMSTCPQCQTRFDCGVVDTGKPASCWCMNLPRMGLPHQAESSDGMLDKALAGKSCLCQTCLKAMRGARSEPAGLGK